MPSKQIPAYTLVEVLIAMIIITIVMGIGGVMFIKTQNIFAGIHGDLIESSDAQQLYTNLQRNMRECKYVIADKAGIHACYPLDTVTYQFHEQYIVRHINGLADTFAIPVLNYEVKQLADTRYTELLILELQNNHTLIKYYFYKAYPTRFHLECNGFITPR